METFVNFSNHPSNKWDEKQIEAARMYGMIVDVPFPAVDPHLDEDGLEHMAEEYIDSKSINISNKEDTFISSHTTHYTTSSSSSSGGHSSGGSFHSSSGSSGGGHSSGGGRHG